MDRTHAPGPADAPGEEGRRPWGTEADRTLLGQFASEVAQRAGYGLCLVQVLRADGVLEVVAVHGTPEQEKQYLGLSAPYEVLQPVYRTGASYGPLTFVAAEWLSDSTRALIHAKGYVGDPDRPTDEGAWRYEDLLFVRLVDEHGALRGIIFLDDPVSGRRPTGADLVRLSDELHMTCLAIVNALVHEELTRAVALADAARRVIRQASAQTTLDELLQLATEHLREGFRATDLQFHLQPAEGYRRTRRERTVSDDLFAALTEATEHAWREGVVVTLEQGRVSGDGGVLTRERRAEVDQRLVERGIDLVVLAPVGTADVFLGTMVITRRHDVGPWTPGETHAAYEVGRDLARAVLNARAHELEHEVTEELKRLDRYRTQLVSTVTHELRNPLGVILGHLELLEAFPDLPRDWNRSLTAIGKAAHRLDRLAEDLLTLSRLDGPDHPLQRDPVDLADVVAEAVELASLDATRRGVQVQVEKGHGPFVVLGDRAELARVVTNLLSNAIKYSDPDDHVVLGLEADASAVVLFCRDEGLGISDADQAMLFEEFFRSTNHAALQRPGTGLGLPILRRIVERHGGRVALTSALGEGSTFTVTLPKE